MTLKQTLKTTLFALGLCLIAGQASAKQNDRAETQRIWVHHIGAWERRDVTAILSDYSADALILVNGKEFRRSQAIGSLFNQLFGLFGRAERHVIDPAIVEPGLVYITWNARIDGHEHPVGTDTFMIRDSKIIYQTITSDEVIFTNLKN
jgi:ketosteroid isomerase-like protein